MKLLGCLVVLVVCLAAPPARAEPPSLLRRCVKCWCPKSLPPVPPEPRDWLPDDYGRKPLPCVPPRVPWGSGDEYDRKCCPIRTGVGWGPEYTCGPAVPCRGNATHGPAR